MNGPDREEVYKIVFELLNPVEARANHAAGSANIRGDILWKPGLPSSGNRVATWPEVQAAVDAAKGAINVFADSSVSPTVIPPGVWNGYGMTRLTSQGGAGFLTTIADGATLVDYAEIRDITIVCECVTTHALSFSPNSSLLLWNFGVIALDVGALVPAIQSPIGFALYGMLATLDNSNAPTVPVLNVGDGEITTVYAHGAAFNFDFLFTGNEIGGGLGATVDWNNDTTVPFLASTLFLGTIQQNGFFTVSDSFSGVAVPVSTITPTTIIAGPKNVMVAEGQKIIVTAALSSLIAAAGPPGSSADFAINVDGIGTFGVNLLTQIPGPVGSAGTILWETTPLAAGTHTVDLVGFTTVAGTTVTGQLTYQTVNG